MELLDVENEVLGLYFARRPFSASQLGVRWGRGAMPPASADSCASLAARFVEVRSRIAGLLDGLLSAEDRLTCRLMDEVCGYEIAALQAGWSRFTVSPLPEAGLASQILTFLPYAALADDESVELYLQSCTGIAGALAAAERELAAGRSMGQVPVRRLVSRAAAQIRAYLDGSVDPFAGALGSRAGAVENIVAQQIRPAFAAHLATLETVVLESGRDDARPGLCWIPGGREVYADAVREYTTLPEGPAHWHGVGLDLVASLRREALGIGVALGWDLGPGKGFDDLRDRLRVDPAVRYRDVAQMLGDARGAMRRAQEAVPDWITDLPAAECELREMSALEAPHGVLGHYESAPLDRSGPGVYWLNTADPGSRPRFEAEALAFHESIPGHHIEISVSQEIVSTSDFRRLVQLIPYTEGWALYTERLADEMGLYSGPLARLGMVSFSLWRAGRLVVDTGLHELGWSRRQAVDYLWHNTMLTRTNIENEVDRYIAHPGSALGYMVGKLAIEQVRARSVAGSSPAELRSFHHQLLQRGPLILGLLAE